MGVEFGDIERYLDEQTKRLVRLKAFSTKSRNDFDEDRFSRDVVEFNFQIIVQCCIDIAYRIIAIDNTRKSTDDYEAISLMGELGVLPVDLTCRMIRLIDFQNMLIYEYMSIDWDEVYSYLQNLDDLERFGLLVREWLVKRPVV